MKLPPDAQNEIAAVAGRLDIEPAALMAVIEVESGGRLFAKVEGRDEPLIRFEGHYFDRRLSSEKREVARAAGLAAPVAGAVANPVSQAERWHLLEAAAMIDRKAAYESTSWGVGQVMGAHWAWLGYAGVDSLVADARGGAAGQIELMARYIDKAGLAPALRARDWAAFARGYNGPDYAKNGYDRKIADAYRRHSGAAASPKTADNELLRPGSRGEAVRDLQRSLTSLGYPLDADGIFGPGTERAVRTFQKEHALAADGIVGPGTAEAIGRAVSPPGPSLWARLLRWISQLFR